jgi:hypothetical protein
MWKKKYYVLTVATLVATDVNRAMADFGVRSHAVGLVYVCGFGRLEDVFTFKLLCKEML